MLPTKLQAMLRAILHKSYFLIGMVALFSTAHAMSDQQAIKDKKNIPEPPPMSADTPEPPPMATDADGDNQIEADVTIIRKKDRTIEEYRINGDLHMVRITPTKGKAYYLLYPKNGGSPVRRDLDDIQTPYWKLFEW